MSDHEHRYFPFEKMITFERTLENDDLPDLYERIEYVIMTCNCGKVIKRRIRSEGDVSENT